MKLTEDLDNSLILKYKSIEFEHLLNEDALREDINVLEQKTILTNEEKEQLELLKAFRSKYCSYPSRAYYDLCEMAQLFD